ncbi:MAG: acyloxyacyl hydrolase [Desulfuromonadales bacterium]|nr:acyloxyacyl hydrolase [Desulfuromonadales bacterium]
MSRYKPPKAMALSLCLLFSLFVGLPVQGQAADVNTARDDSPSVNVALGTVNLLDAHKKGYLGLEYRVQPLGDWQLRPVLATGWITDAAWHIAAGLKRDFRIDKGWTLTPGFSVLFFEDGDIVTLGSSIQFKSELEISYRFPGQNRLGLAFFHVSNGGLGDKNPGTEALVLSFGVPLTL